MKNIDVGATVVLRAGPLQTIGGEVFVGDHGTVVAVDEEFGVLVEWPSGVKTWCHEHDGSRITEATASTP